MAATSPGSWVEAKDAEEETDSASGSPAEGLGKARDGAGSGRGEDAAPCARLRRAPGGLSECPQDWRASVSHLRRSLWPLSKHPVARECAINLSVQTSTWIGRPSHCLLGFSYQEAPFPLRSS